MFCIVKYSDIEKKDSEIKEGTTDSKSSVDRSCSQKSFERTEIRCDDEIKELIINPYCLTRILLDYVCEQLCIEKNAEIDFCDEFGRLAKINTLNNWEYATAALKPQLTYVVILFQRGKHGKYKSIRPLLTKYCKLYADVIFHLKSQFSSSSIYISDKSSSRSFNRVKGSKASLRLSDKYRPGSVPSKTSDLKSKHKSSEGSAVQPSLKASSKLTLRDKESKRSLPKSAQAALGMESEIEIKKKESMSPKTKEKQRGKSPK